MKINPSLRVLESNESWDIINVVKRRKFNTKNSLLVAILIELSSFNSIDISTFENTMKEISKKFNVEHDLIKTIINTFIKYDLLIDANSELEEWAVSVYELGIKSNWVEANDYHILSSEYPFLDYDSDARKIDKERMTKYTQEERDEKRYKVYEDSKLKITAPKPSPELCPFTLEEVILNKTEKNKLELEFLLKIMSMTFGSIGYYTPPWENAEKVLRKTSPSGGARHPSEGYVLVLNINGMTPGWYHYSVKNNELELVSDDVQLEEVEEMLFGPYKRADFNIQAIVIITSVFERNMYRYREPRTFRSIHMDVGHLCSTLEYVAAGYGIQSFPHYGLSESKVEKKLGLDFLKEGVFMGITLGH